MVSEMAVIPTLVFEASHIKVPCGGAAVLLAQLAWSSCSLDTVDISLAFLPGFFIGIVTSSTFVSKSPL